MRYKFNIFLSIDIPDSLTADVGLSDIRRTEQRTRNNILMWEKTNFCVRQILCQVLILKLFRPVTLGMLTFLIFRFLVYEIETVVLRFAKTFWRIVKSPNATYIMLVL